MTGVESGEQDTAGWSTNRCSGIGVCKSHPFVGHAINGWSEEIGMPHMSGFEVTPFVEHEIDDIGLLFPAACERDGREDQEEDGKELAHGMS